MAGARPFLLDPDPDRVLIAVYAHLDHPLDVAGGLALLPQGSARTTEVPSLAARDGLGERLGVHVRHHQDLARARIGRDAGDEPVGVEFGREGEAFLDLLGRAARAKS